MGNLDLGLLGQLLGSLPEFSSKHASGKVPDCLEMLLQECYSL
jgi:hypothetical protein